MSAVVPSSCSMWMRPETPYPRWAAWQLSVPTTGLIALRTTASHGWKVNRPTSRADRDESTELYATSASVSRCCRTSVARGN